MLVVLFYSMVVMFIKTHETLLCYLSLNMTKRGIGMVKKRPTRNKKGMVGIEAAIVLIAFVIVAAAFSYMVVNMGLFATQKGRDVIQQGVSESGSPLVIDGSFMIRATAGKADAALIPLKTMGVRYVPMKNGTSEISLKVGDHSSYADVYYGINNTDPTNARLDDLLDAATNTTGGNTGFVLFIGNNNGDTSLSYDEKGYLILYLSGTDQADERDNVFAEIRPEMGAPLSIEFIVPPHLSSGWLTIGS
jgi:flagellin FlaB